MIANILVYTASTANERQRCLVIEDGVVGAHWNPTGPAFKVPLTYLAIYYINVISST